MRGPAHSTARKGCWRASRSADGSGGFLTEPDRERLLRRLESEIGRVDNDLKAAIADLKADMKLLKFGYGPAILGLLIMLVFFP